MSEDFGDGVTRTLSALQRNFSHVVWQAKKPPLDSELNLMSQLEAENNRLQLQAEMASGFILDPTRTKDSYEFDQNWSNYFVLGNPRDQQDTLEGNDVTPALWAHVNGWVVPVAGAQSTTASDVRNKVYLYPPPTSGVRADMVFLEVWEALISPNPSTSNKPSASEVYRFGNVEHGSNVSDDLEDPTILFETTKRVQVQYRLRVYGNGTGAGAGVDLETYPDGLGDPNILGQGAAASPVGGFAFSNMREELGDPGLWRAGDGDPDNALGTVDGYVYAIPVCAVFRRNSAAFTAVNTGGSPNQNGGFNRNPGASLLADPRLGAKELLTATLTAALDPGTTGVVSVTDVNGSGLEDGALTLASTFLVIDDEIIGISAVDTGAGTITIPVGGRGRYATDDTGHAAGSVVRFYNPRPDGFFSDEVTDQDVLDLRMSVNPGAWDYQRILKHNLAALVQGTMRTAWKQAGSGGDPQGPVITEVGYLLADGATAVPTDTEALDGPDGVRYIWSDAAVIQPDVTVLCDNDAALTSKYITSTQFDTTVDWDVAPDFTPTGFMNLGSGPNPTASWTNGSVVFLHIGGASGTEGARGTFRDGAERAVRFVSPQEYWLSPFAGVQIPATDSTLEQKNYDGNQNPIALRFLNEAAFEPAPEGEEAESHPGPMYPVKELNFEYPFIALGGLLRTDMKVSIDASDLSESSGVSVVGDVVLLREIDVGINFDASGNYFFKDSDGNFYNDPNLVGKPLMNGRKTLYGMLTNDGRDETGLSSQVYLVVYGDPDSQNNNGAFQVIGAGTNATGYTRENASGATKVVVRPLSADYSIFDATGNTGLTAEFRSQFMNVEDGAGKAAGQAAACIVMTDLGGSKEHPWNSTTLAAGAQAGDLSMPIDVVTTNRVAIPSKLQISTTLLYNPGRGSNARVPDTIDRIAVKGADSTYLRQAPGSIDATFEAASGAPSDETFYDIHHIQTWNRLSSRGQHAPYAPEYGGQVIGFTEQDRETEALIDKGSKTLVFRPFRDREMTLQGIATNADPSIIGEVLYPSTDPKDGLSLWTTNKLAGFSLPREFMPRFGRQDIPVHVDQSGGTGTFLTGLNHLFVDDTDETSAVFHIIGGEDNTSGGNEVKPLYFVTDTPANYGQSSTTIGVVSSVPNLMARKTTEIPNTTAVEKRIRKDIADVNSSDLGSGLKGIQLPPHYGPARIYGIYDRADFISQGGATFQADRITPDASPATNLIRLDADRQTLFILQDGAEDLTTETGDHTYIIPEQLIDVTKSPNYTGTETFDDFDYVVECVVFGFAKGWINENNFVLLRAHNGAGTAFTDASTPELEGIHMVLPCPAANNDPVYTLYNRTAYQGDPYGTRSGATRTMADYTNRYGQVTVANAFELDTPIQQFDSNGDLNIETPNARAFQVLAALDFYTTLGTGKIGGQFYAGTPLDVGYIADTEASATRIPGSDSDPRWQVSTRAFSEGQKENTSRASIEMEILRNDHLNPVSLFHHYLEFLLGDGTIKNIYGSTAANNAALVGSGVLATDIYEVDSDSSTESIVHTETIDWSNFQPGQTRTQTVTVNGAVLGGSVNITPPAAVTTYATDQGLGLVFDGWVSATNTVVIRALHTGQFIGTEALEKDGNVTVITTNFDVPSIGAGVTASVPFTHTGAEIGDVAVVSVSNPGPDAGLMFHAHVTVDDQVLVKITNTTGSPIDMVASDFTIAVFKEAPSIDIDPPSGDWIIEATQEIGTEEKSAENLVTLINNHADLKSWIQASRRGRFVKFESVPVGEEGNNLRLTMNHDYGPYLSTAARLVTPTDNNSPSAEEVTSAQFSGGRDIPVNGGEGISPLRLTGMTERLPLGILLQDSDFLGENILRDNATAFKTSPSGIRPVQSSLPLTEGGEEYTRFLGVPGELVAMSDGAVLTYQAFTDDQPAGTKKFRLYRGGGACFVLSGDNPGGPVDWVSDAFSSSLQPVLKGGVLVGKALLVRNFYEEPFSTPAVASDGDEIQMVVITHGILGGGDTINQGVNLRGVISPTGYGEGYAAADRFRVAGRPMYRSASREVRDPDTVELAPFPGSDQ